MNLQNSYLNRIFSYMKLNSLIQTKPGKNKLQNIKNIERKKYLINAYRVLLTIARQRKVIVVLKGNTEHHARMPEY